MKLVRFALVSLALLLVPTFIAVGPLAAQSVSVYATGLNGPRGLKFGPDGFLYVAEAGRGGSTPAASFDCDQVPGPVGPYFGGRTTRHSKKSATRQKTNKGD